MFGIRVKLGHKNLAEDLGTGKTTAWTETQVCIRLWHTSTRAEADVRKWFSQEGRQQIVFTGLTRRESAVREHLCFWTDLPVAGNYPYPEHTPFGDSGSFGGFATFTCPEEGRKTRVVPEGRFLHFPRGGSRALDFTKYGQEPNGMKLSLNVR
jgi:hypothetical protein